MKRPFVFDSWRQPLRQIDDQPAGHLWHGTIVGREIRGAAVCGQRPAWRWSWPHRGALGPELADRCPRCHEILMRRAGKQREIQAGVAPELPLERSGSQWRCPDCGALNQFGAHQCHACKCPRAPLRAVLEEA